MKKFKKAIKFYTADNILPKYEELYLELFNG